VKQQSFARNFFPQTIVILAAAFHARVVLGLVSEVVTMGEIENVRAQLPAGLRQLFEVANEGELPGQGVIVIPEL
jgi:hypothetical protein